MESMNTKQFLNRQIYVTSVVADSQMKPAVQIQSASGGATPESQASQVPPPETQSLYTLYVYALMNVV